MLIKPESALLLNVPRVNYPEKYFKANNIIQNSNGHSTRSMQHA